MNLKFKKKLTFDAIYTAINRPGLNPVDVVLHKHSNGEVEVELLNGVTLTAQEQQRVETLLANFGFESVE